MARPAPFRNRALLALLVFAGTAATVRAQLPALFSTDPEARYEEEHTTWLYPPWEHTWGVVRATQSHLSFFTLGKASFTNPQGLAAVRLEATDDPEVKGDDDEVTVYGVNSGEHAIIYNKSMRSIGLYGYGDEGGGNLRDPWDITADPEGRVYVSDGGNRRVVRLRNVEGELIYEGDFGREPPFSLVLPRGIQLTASGEVIVADAGSGRIVFADTAGTFHHALENFDRPVGLAAVDARQRWTRPRDRYVVVTDSGGRRLSKLRWNGALVARIDIAEATGLEDPYVGHVDIDLYHNVIATDSANARILKFDPELNFLASWGQEGTGRTRFRGPTGIAIWRRYGQTFVAEAQGAHYLWVGVDQVRPPELEVDAKAQSLSLGLTLTERAWVTLELVEDGEVLRAQKRILEAGGDRFEWQIARLTPGLDEGRMPGASPPGRDPLPAGEYGLRVRIRPTYSSRKVFEKVVETTIRLEGPQERNQ